MNSELQHKLFHYHAQPPLQTWDKIRIALEGDANSDFQIRLENYHETPPAFVWDNIAVSLDESETPILPFRKGFAKLARYSAVAASLLFAALLINLMLSKKSVSGEGVTSIKKPDIAIPETIKKTQEIPNNYQAGINEVQKNIVSIKRKGDLPENIQTLRSSYEKSNPKLNSIVIRKEPTINTELLERYNIISKSSGEAFRVSKKLYDLFLCSEINEYCRLNIEMVKGKIASPSMLASADFSGVMDLLQRMNNQ